MLKKFISNIKKITNNSTNKGFTLIEILIVVMIIGILAGIMLRVINIDDVRKKTRDSQRIADLKKIQTSLELYFVDNRIYPTTSGWVTINGTDSISTILKGTSGDSYINQVPTDPKTGTLDYMYRSDTGGIYYLTAPMELSDNANLSPCTDSQYTEVGCYEVQNPL